MLSTVYRLLLFFSGCFSLLAGCGPQGPDLGPYGLVSGQITYQGTPISKGMITFHSHHSGQVATANLESDGSYSMKLAGRDGLPIGEYQICIRPPLTAQQGSDPSMRRRNNLYDPTISTDIPMKYRYESSSGLDAQVLEGDNRFDFDLLPDDGEEQL